MTCAVYVAVALLVAHLMTPLLLMTAHLVYIPPLPASLPLSSYRKYALC